MAIFLPTTVATPGDFSIKACDSCYLMSAEICVEDGNKRSYEVTAKKEKERASGNQTHEPWKESFVTTPLWTTVAEIIDLFIKNSTSYFNRLEGVQEKHLQL